MENKMFCYQCEQTAGCTGCTQSGVCGKSADTARLQDELTGALIGLARATESNPATQNTYQTIIEGLFTTITNVSFDDEAIIRQIERPMRQRKNWYRAAEAVARLAARQKIMICSSFGMTMKTFVL